MVLWDIQLLVDILFFWQFEPTISVFSVLHDFWWEQNPFWWILMRTGLFHLMLSRFSLSLAFSSLTMMCLGVVLFEFILHEVRWPSLMCRLMFFIKLGKLLTFISLDILSIPLFLSFCSGNSHNAYVHVDGAPWVSEAQFILFLFWFVYVLFIYFFLHVFLSQTE